MDAHYRRLFNEAFSPAVYARYCDRLARRLNVRFEFRLAESPVFLPADLRARCTKAAAEILEQLAEPANLKRMKEAIPEEWRSPRMDALPSFAQIDFAITRDADGRLVPRLVELQGFPSLTAFQVIQRDVWSEILSTLPGLNKDWSCWFSGLDRSRFLDLARRAIVGNHDPKNVILMDIDPPTQKTFPDFAATKKLFDVDAVCPTTLVRRGRKLYRREGHIEVKRIHTRVVFDELIRKNIRLPFRFTDDLDVEWAPHPNWFWTWSKQSMIDLDHPAVPRTVLLSALKATPEDLSQRFVLKPLFSFAGGGVNVAPSKADLDRVPQPERSQWCLQEKLDYAPVIDAADGGQVKVEMRMMIFKVEGGPPVIAQNLCRLSRGKMMGVDFNKNFTWVGSSIALFESGEPESGN